ncbi:MAG: RHS repeat-associated core domain-containing protein [Fimbriimonas sp.]
MTNVAKFRSATSSKLILLDAAGRLRKIEHWWDTRAGGTDYDPTYNSEAILGANYGYELSGLNRGLRTNATFIKKNPSGTSFVNDWMEVYEYQESSVGSTKTRDFLTKFTTTDGLGTPMTSWTYDAAGNRSWHTVDNLNLLTANGSNAYTNDILGNRTSWTPSGGTARTYAWDAINRMTAYTNPSGTTTYTYRADGMRVKKSSTSATTLWRYDGQMPMEEATGTSVTSYGLGARGLDILGKDGNISFPVYDGHGNMVATLARNGTGYTVSNRRSFDPWGNVRLGATTGDPKGRYCASLGHIADDESGLTYMRARYYSPGDGRFISEDPARSGWNWYAYCRADPVNRVDRSGRVDLLGNEGLQILGVLTAVIPAIGVWATAINQGGNARVVALTAIFFMIAYYGLDMNDRLGPPTLVRCLGDMLFGKLAEVSMLTLFGDFTKQASDPGGARQSSLAISSYCMLLLAIIAIDSSGLAG